MFVYRVQAGWVPWLWVNMCTSLPGSMAINLRREEGRGTYLHELVISCFGQILGVEHFYKTFSHNLYRNFLGAGRSSPLVIYIQALALPAAMLLAASLPLLLPAALIFLERTGNLSVYSSLP